MTRITIFIPITQQSKKHIDYFLRKLSGDLGGFTISRYQVREAVFKGGWVNKNRLIKDNIAQLIVDSSKNGKSIRRYLRALKLEMQKKFKEQKMWITIQNIEQII